MTEIKLPEEPQNPDAEFQLDGFKVLVVEDNQSNLELLRFALGKKNLEVIVATTGEEALAKIKDEKPDIMLLDIELPDTSGIHLCKKLKEQKEYVNLPVLFVTGHSDPQVIVKGFQAGAADYIVKPIKLPEVIARLKTHLKMSYLIKLEKGYNEALQKANDEINKLLGVATHDLRNPLVSIRGLIEFLRDGTTGPLNDSQKELADNIHDASEMLLFLVENLLDYSSVESSIINLECSETDLRELVEKAVKLHNITASKKNIKLEAEIKGYEKHLNLDKNRIAQVVDNLITNAIKFSPFDKEIRVVLTQDDKQTKVEVIDQGQGVPEKEMGKLFTTFGKTSVRPTNNEQSTGLGLAICRKIIESHKGTIQAVNNPNGGAAFSFTLKNK